MHILASSEVNFRRVGYPAAGQNKSYGQAEFDADKSADTVEAEKDSLSNKDAEKDIRQVLEPKGTKRSDQD